MIGRYTQVIIAQLMQSTACNARHGVAQRCARWLLMTHDRMRQQDFNLSHEFLAIMLGVQRPTVNIAAATLQEAGLIRYIHGRVTVRDRKALEKASCGATPSPALSSTGCNSERQQVHGNRLSAGTMPVPPVGAGLLLAFRLFVTLQLTLAKHLSRLPL